MNPAHLAAIRVSHRDAIDRAAARANHYDEPQGMPGSLVSAGCWLIAHGIADDEPCVGERFFKQPLCVTREYFAGLDEHQRAVEIADGERAIYHGRHPLFVALVEERRAA